MKKRIVIIVVVVAAIFAGLAYSEGWFSRDSSLQGSGTVEARDIRVGSKVGGRIDKIFVREGDTVKAGQVLITFDDKELAGGAGSVESGGGKSGARVSARGDCGSESGGGCGESGIRTTEKWLSSRGYLGGAGGPGTREGRCCASETRLRPV